MFGQQRKKEPPEYTMCIACFVNHPTEIDTQGRPRHWNADKSESILCSDYIWKKMTTMEQRYWLEKFGRNI